MALGYRLQSCLVLKEFHASTLVILGPFQEICFLSSAFCCIHMGNTPPLATSIFSTTIAHTTTYWTVILLDHLAP